MKPFHFDLAALLDFRRHRRDLCRQLLQAVTQDAQRLPDRRNKLEQGRNAELETLRRAGKSGVVDLGASSFRRHYARQIADAIAQLDLERNLVARQIDQAREDLRHADQGVAALEKLEARRRSEHRVCEDRRESRELHDLILCRTLARTSAFRG